MIRRIDSFHLVLPRLVWRTLLAIGLALLLVTTARARTGGEATVEAPVSPQIAAAVALRERLLSPAAGRRLTPSHHSVPGHLSQEQDTLRALYSRRGFAPLWVRSGQPTRAAAAMVQLVCNAGDYGLEAEGYGCAALSAQLRFLQGYGRVAAADASSAQEWTDFEVGVSAALSAFLNDVHGGRIDPRRAGFELPPRSTLDIASLLRRIALGADPASIVAGIEPGFIHYHLLEAALPRYRALAQHPELTALPLLPRAKLTLGDRYLGTPALRRLLVAVGCLKDEREPSDRERIDAALVGGIKCFQWRHGLRADGVLGRETYKALTVPFIQRVRQIELTLERWRWLPALQPRTILVNIPQFRLFAFESAEDSEQGMLRMDVIVGREYRHTQTPVFTADMTAVVFRPYWDVPHSIVAREILPELAHDPGYLARNHFELVRGETDASPVVSVTPENLQALALGKLRLRQRPGSDNALGLLKFLLPNAHDVYLHDTPAAQLFQHAQRTFSHGCIRVSDPVALARFVLAHTDDWPVGKITAAMHGNTTLRVPLAHPVHVLILYGTALASEDGAVHFFNDVYGQDRRLQQLLGLPPVTTNAARPSGTHRLARISLPEAYAAGVDVHEVRAAVEAHSAESR